MKKPTLYIANNTSAIIPVSLFSQTPPNNSIINSGGKYSWNMCSQLFTNLTTVMIQRKAANSITFTNYTANITESGLFGLIKALNTLGIGIFFSETINGFPNISVEAGQFVYGDLDITDNAPATQLSYAWQFNFAGVPDPNYTFDIQNVTDSLFIFNSAPNTLMGSGQSPVQGSRGDTVEFQGNFLLPHTGKIFLYLNGCLQQTIPFAASFVWFAQIIYDRSDDIYRLVFNVQ